MRNGHRMIVNHPQLLSQQPTIIEATIITTSKWDLALWLLLRLLLLQGIATPILLLLRLWLRVNERTRVKVLLSTMFPSQAIPTTKIERMVSRSPPWYRQTDQSCGGGCSRMIVNGRNVQLSRLFDVPCSAAVVDLPMNKRHLLVIGGWYHSPSTR